MRPKYTLGQLKKKIKMIKKGKAAPKEIEGWLLAAFTNYRNRPSKDIWGDGRGIGLEIVRNMRRYHKAQIP
jgi:hypothetical protein